MLHPPAVHVGGAGLFPLAHFPIALQAKRTGGTAPETVCAGWDTNVVDFVTNVGSHAVTVHGTDYTATFFSLHVAGQQGRTTRLRTDNVFTGQSLTGHVVGTLLKQAANNIQLTLLIHHLQTQWACLCLSAVAAEAVGACHTIGAGFPRAANLSGHTLAIHTNVRPPVEHHTDIIVVALNVMAGVILPIHARGAGSNLATRNGGLAQSVGLVAD